MLMICDYAVIVFEINTMKIKRRKREEEEEEEEESEEHFLLIAKTRLFFVGI